MTTQSKITSFHGKKDGCFNKKYGKSILDKRTRKLKRKSRMDKQEIRTTLGTRLRTKENKTKKRHRPHYKNASAHEG